IWTPCLTEDQMMFANKTMLECSNRLINNFSPLIFSFVSGKNEESRRFYEIIASCENFLGKRIKSVSLFDQDNKEVAQTSLIPIKKRIFILSMWPWQREFKNWFVAGHKAKKVWEKCQTTFSYDSVLRHFRDNQNKGYVGRVKAVGLWKNNKAFCVLLSNNVDWSSREIIEAFVQRWPLLDRGHLLDVWINEKQIKKEKKENAQKKIGVQKNIFEDLGSEVKDLCMKEIFLLDVEKEEDQNVFKEMCELEGVLRRQNGVLEVRLIVTDRFRQKELLQRAFNRINERNVVDTNGLRVQLRRY
ncbi:hypothetical protein ACFL49_02795, partial [Candidatus Omnitrophota bacterium]